MVWAQVTIWPRYPHFSVTIIVEPYFFDKIKVSIFDLKLCPQVFNTSRLSTKFQKFSTDYYRGMEFPKYLCIIQYSQKSLFMKTNWYLESNSTIIFYIRFACSFFDLFSCHQCHLDIKQKY